MHLVVSQAQALGGEVIDEEIRGGCAVNTGHKEIGHYLSAVCDRRAGP